MIFLILIVIILGTMYFNIRLYVIFSIGTMAAVMICPVRDADSAVLVLIPAWDWRLYGKTNWFGRIAASKKIIYAMNILKKKKLPFGISWRYTSATSAVIGSEAHQSPLFMGYHDNQPWNENPLRPCQVLDNPGRLTAIVEKSSAKSTDYQNLESAEEFSDKCVETAQKWAPVADRL